MRRTSCLGVLAGLVTIWAWHQGSAFERMPRPSDGMIADGIYTNDYFHLSYPLPPGWAEAMAGPGPSTSGHYVLATLTPAGEFTGTILVTAQDAFFAVAGPADLAAAAQGFAESISAIEGMSIDRPPSDVALAGRVFRRIDFSGVGLFRSTFLTYSRCHLVGFNLTANRVGVLAALVRSLDELGGPRDGAAPDPPCVRDYARAENILTKVDPAPSGPTYTPIPVRIVIGSDGAVRDVNVIRASVVQRTSIERALRQWRFKPPAIDGRAIDIETGLLIEFTPGGVSYSTGDRP